MTQKKDYNGPLYAPWYKVVLGKAQFQEWLKKQSKQKK